MTQISSIISNIVLFVCSFPDGLVSMSRLVVHLDNELLENSQFLGILDRHKCSVFH